MKKYYNFDVDGFFRDYIPNQKRLKELETEYNSIPDSISISLEGGGIGGSMPKSSVEQKADRREQILAKMTEYDDYFHIADKIINGLSMNECMILNEYFIKRKRAEANVIELSEKLYVSIATMYRKIKKLRHRIREIVEE